MSHEELANKDYAEATRIWQPMHTAPRDGQQILVRRKSHRDGGPFLVQREDDGRVYVYDGPEYGVIYYSHERWRNASFLAYDDHFWHEWRSLDGLA